MERTKLSDRIWLTRKLRIGVATRLMRSSIFGDLLLTYYAIASMFFAICDIRDVNKDYAYQLLALAIFTFGCSLYLPSRRFAERAAELKTCYVALDGLISRAEIADREQSEKNLIDLATIEKEYHELLLAHENQTDFDFFLLKFRLGGKNPDLRLGRSESFFLAGHIIARILVLLALLTLPFILLYSF